MSQENVEVVRRAFAAYERHDVEALATFTDVDVELDWSASRGWFAGVYRGQESVLRLMSEFLDTFEAVVIEADSYIPVRAFVVVPHLTRQSARGVEVTARSTFVFTLSDGKITRICLYQETAEALKAVELEE